MLLSLAALLAAATATQHQPKCSGMIDEPRLEFSEPMNAVEVESGERLEIVCQVFASPQVSFVWLHNGKEILAQDSSKEYLLASGKRMAIGVYESRITRDCANAAHSGVYTCIAMSPCSPSIEAETTVVVKTASRLPAKCQPGAPSISLFTASRMELPHNPVQLLCRTNNHDAHTHWERLDDDGNVIGKVTEHHPGFLQLPSGDLLVDPVATAAYDSTELVSVLLRCVVTNTHGIASADSSVLFLDE